MKSSQVTNILTVLCVCSALAFVALCWQTRSQGSAIRQLQPQILQAQQRAQAANAMIMELMEYGKTNPQIMPILKTASSKPAASAPSPQ